MAAEVAPDPEVVRAHEAHVTVAAACDAGHPHHHAGRRDTRIRDPYFDDPVEYASRTDWQRALWKAKYDPQSKRYLKQLENLVVDGWEATFDKLWGVIEESLDRGLPITNDVLAEYIYESSRKQLRQLDRDAWDSAFNGLYVGAKEQSYRLTGYGEKKERLAQVVDTLEEQAILARLRETALGKVKTITDTQLHAEVLKKLSEPGAFAKSPTALANEIIRQERRKLEEAIKDRKELRARIKDLYDNQLWKMQRITRTEGANAYWLSTLRGYQEQGIVAITFHSHSLEQNTCSLCLELNNTVHRIDDLLAGDGARYPLSTLTHPQCRCWPSPVIAHVTLESMEELYEDEPELFAPGQTVFDRDRLDKEDVVREYQEVYGTEIHDLPVEHADDVEQMLGIIKKTPYQQYQPVQLRYVEDVGAVPAFLAAVPTPEPVVGQVVSWTGPDDEVYISKFSTDGGHTVSGALIREWAGRLYDDQASISAVFEGLFERDDTHPAKLQKRTIDKLLRTFDPFTMMRQQLIGTLPTVTVNKKLRDAPAARLHKVLSDLGIDADDIETIVKWRDDRPVWTLDGRYVPQNEPAGSYHNRFVNRAAELGAREMFVESVAAYVMDPWTFYQRDRETYDVIKEKVFDGREFKKG